MRIEIIIITIIAAFFNAGAICLQNPSRIKVSKRATLDSTAEVEQNIQIDQTTIQAVEMDSIPLTTVYDTSNSTDQALQPDQSVVQSAVAADQMTSQAVEIDQTIAINQATTQASLEDQMTTLAVLREVTTPAVSEREMTTQTVPEGGMTTQAVSESRMAAQAASEDNITTQAVLENGMTTQASSEGGMTTQAASEDKITTQAVLEGEITTQAALEDKITTEAGPEQEMTTQAASEDEMTTQAASEDKITTQAVPEQEMITQTVLDDEVTTQAPQRGEKTTQAALKEITTQTVQTYPMNQPNQKTIDSNASQQVINASITLITSLSEQTKKKTVKITVTQNITKECLGCMCALISQCRASPRCSNGLCSKFHINLKYWIDAGNKTVNDEKPSSSTAFVHCMRNDKCARKTVKSYMRKHAQDCNEDGFINCYDYAQIHHYAPSHPGEMKCRKDNLNHDIQEFMWPCLRAAEMKKFKLTEELIID